MGLNKDWCEVEYRKEWKVEDSQIQQEINFKMKELEKLKSVLPSCQGEDLTQMEIILEAIQYIEDLQRKLDSGW